MLTPVIIYDHKYILEELENKYHTKNLKKIVALIKIEQLQAENKHIDNLRLLNKVFIGDAVNAAEEIIHKDVKEHLYNYYGIDRSIDV